MVDLATRQRLNVASGGPLAEDLVFTAEGRLLVANSQQVDVVMPVTPPNIIAVTPADGLIVPLPQNTVRIVFDQDLAYVEEERETAGALPTDRRIVVERFRDELGDWRLVLLSLPWLWSFRRRVLFLGIVGLFLLMVSWLFHALVEGPFQKLSRRLDYRENKLG